MGTKPDMDAETIKKLRELAEKAPHWPFNVFQQQEQYVRATEFINAANPAVILSLIDALETERSGTEAMRKALEPLLRGIDQSRWHDVNGEKMKRVLVAPTAIDRLRAALSTPNPGDADGRCPKCGAGPIGNCGFYGAETPRSMCPLPDPPASTLREGEGA